MGVFWEKLPCEYNSVIDIYCDGQINAWNWSQYIVCFISISPYEGRQTGLSCEEIIKTHIL